MKTKYLILPLMFISNLVFGQLPKNLVSIEDKEFNKYFLNKDNKPVVKGKILNLTAEEIKQIKIDYFIETPFEQFQVNKSCTLSPDGSFEFELDYPFPYRQIGINIAKLFWAGVYANTDLYIELDAQLIKQHGQVQYNGVGVKYLGKDGPLNTYRNNHILFKREKQLETFKAIFSLRGGTLKNPDLDYPVFFKKYDSLYTILNAIDKEYINQNPSNFSWIIINERLSDYYSSICFDNWGRQMPDDLFQKIKNHKAYLTSYYGMSFYNSLFHYLNLLANPDNSINQIQKTINLFDSLFAPPKSDFLKIKFSRQEPSEQKIIFETILPQIKTEWCKNTIQEQYTKRLEKLASINKLTEKSNFTAFGQPLSETPFGAKLYKVDTLSAKTLLSNIKKSFQGKALLIDFWATWCGPCIAAFPHSKKLHESTVDLPIEFIYLCTSANSDFEKWKSKITEYKLSGTHIYVEKDIESELMEMLSINGFPNYVLINLKGEYKPGAIANDKFSSLDKEKLAELIK
jgi:thiol-disulfide isomerase/thioredoxin